MIVSNSATRRIARSWFTATCMVASAFISAAPARAQAPDTPRILEFRSFSFAMPGPDWQQVDDTSTPDPALPRPLVMVKREEPLHQQLILVIELEAPPALIPAEIAAQVFEADRKSTASGGALQWSQPSTRTINGVAYPVLPGQFTPNTGTPIRNSLELLYFSQDFEQRHRFYALLWTDTHSATVSAKDPAEFDALVGSVNVRPVGTVLLSDDLTDPAAGRLPQSSADPDHYQRGYIDGEYVLQKVDPEWETQILGAFVPGTFADTTLAVDARLVSESAPQMIELACRVDPKNAKKQYRLILDPDGGRFRFGRDDESGWTWLVDYRPTPFLLGGDLTNHIELTCAGSTFSATANGQPIFQLRDNKYREGRLELMVEARSALVEGRFSNLVVTQR